GYRQAIFSVRTNTGTNGAFVELPGTSTTITNNVPTNGTISIALPVGFSNNPNAKIRFYIQTVTGTANNSVSGSRPRMAIDNIRATATYTGTNPNTITTGTPSNNNFTVTTTTGSSSVTVPYTSTGTFTGQWRVQLSNEEGLFSTDETINIIGTGNGTSPITAQIPAGTPCGTGYRVRVINTAPLRFSPSNQTTITVNSNPGTNSVTLDNTDPQTVTNTGSGSGIRATATSPSTFNWGYRVGNTGAFTPFPNATANSYTIKGTDFPGPGNYQLAATATAISACYNVTGTTAPVLVQVQGISVSPGTLTFAATGVGRESAVQNLTLTGTGLTGNVTITPPAGFQIRLGSTNPFSTNPLELTPTSGDYNATLDVRFVPTAAQAYTGNINFASNVNTVNVAVSGTGMVALPLLTTNPVTNITATSAISGGEITSNGGATVTVRGVVWGVSPNPGLGTSNATSEGTGTGTYSSNLPNLQQNTLYYARAYATNSAGTAYGNVWQFTTFPAAPTLQASNLSFPENEIMVNSVTITWTKGNGTGALVKINTVNSFTAPVNGESITAVNSSYSGNGEQAVFLGDNTVTRATITNLKPATQYWFRVYEFNNQNANIRYNTEGAAVSIKTLTPLPVELAYFKAVPTRFGVELQWSTVSEVKNSHFNLLRSLDAKNFETIGLVKGAGNSYEIKHYTFLDKTPATVKNNIYYVLEQVDFDGTTTRSGIISLQSKEIIAPEVSLFPNPVQDILTVYNPGKFTITRFKILNSNGETVLEPTLQKSPADSYMVDVSGLPHGVYIFQILNQDQITQKRRFVKTSR
ncbi:MAG: T9SS type A sorting domain-containing protein, partial [Bacteroidota bacterium]|nr:T9SS type A sorting domain-containing protein [Bacteroidota bacterium]